MWVCRCVGVNINLKQQCCLMTSVRCSLAPNFVTTFLASKQMPGSIRFCCDVIKEDLYVKFSQQRWVRGAASWSHRWSSLNLTFYHLHLKCSRFRLREAPQILLIFVVVSVCSWGRYIFENLVLWSSCKRSTKGSTVVTAIIYLSKLVEYHIFE